jgi:hypothetical protein
VQGVHRRQVEPRGGGAGAPAERPLGVGVDELDALAAQQPGELARPGQREAQADGRQRRDAADLGWPFVARGPGRDEHHPVPGGSEPAREQGHHRRHPVGRRVEAVGDQGDGGRRYRSNLVPVASSTQR